MYLKVKTHEKANGWRIFECHKPQWHHYTWKEWSLMIFADCAEVHRFVPGEKELLTNDVIITGVSFYDESGTPTEVYGIHDMYLLSNAGTTIERVG